MRVSAVIACIALSSCNPFKTVTALEACHKLERAGVASNCHDDKPGGLGANAVERVEYDLVSVPGHGGSVLRFDSAEKYDECVKEYDDNKILTGPHRYGNKRKKVFTQFNEGASMEVGSTAKKTLEAL